MKFLKVNYPVYQTGVASRLLNDFLTSEFCYDRYGRNELVNPATNLYENEQEVEIKMSLPGYEKDQVKIEVAEDLLVVKGEAEDQTQKESRDVRVEFRTGNFEKKFRLSEKLDAAKINASFKNGILTITVSKKEETIPQRREVEIG
ncbi:MAG: Hsp20/alpha crystallin family protein [Prolixibacteraceae bacterium]